MTSTDSITVRDDCIETDTHLHQAVVVRTGDPPVRDLPLEREKIEHSSRSSEDIHASFREMVKDIDVTVNVYQPGEFESPIHEGLTRLSHFLVILSVSITDTPAAEAKEILTTAQDSLHHSWSEKFTLGFEAELLKYGQDHVLPLLEETPDQ